MSTKMDSDEEKLGYLWFLGIFEESFKIIVSWKKILTQITLAFILPLSIIFFVQFQVSENLKARIQFENTDFITGETMNAWMNIYHPSE